MINIQELHRTFFGLRVSTLRSPPRCARPFLPCSTIRPYKRGPNKLDSRLDPMDGPKTNRRQQIYKRQAATSLRPEKSHGLHQIDL